MYVYKQGSGTWEVEGKINIDDGRLFVDEGTLICNGSDNIVSHDIEVQDGGRLTGECGFTILDQQEDFYFKSGATLVPGKNGVGTITIGWNSTRNATAEAQLLTGSTYEWEVGAGNATDKLHVKKNAKAVLLKLQDFTLKILDAGSTPSTSDQLPVFTYETGVTRSIGTVTFDTSELGGSWDTSSLSLVDDTEGTIYLTGLSASGSGTLILLK